MKKIVSQSQQLILNRKLEAIHQEIKAIGAEMEKIARANAGRRAKAWVNLQRDQLKLKDEYERLLKRANAPVTDTGSVKSLLAHQSRALASAREKRAPEDTHYRGDS